ncbi:MAG: membrane protein insertase YidC, partial [Candidatus Competibacteraceae bacterium]|nr:membrane protein insertase YidC [Candidatus Competibacteraceae bacterium]
LGAWIPAQDELNKFYSRALGDGRYRLGMVSAEQTIAAGQTGTFATQLYVGPKIQERLEGLAPNLSRTVDYGWLWFIAEPLFVILKWLHGLLGNWGWSIILLTVMIKAVFFKLSETSYRSMANMRKLAPKLQQMKERYGDDRAKLNQAMMEMYKKEKINPLGGCLPILVQIPVFIALYWMLLESVELRQAPWLGWIQDLSTKDPFYILPLIMGVSMFIQQRLNPTPPDPIQAKVMMALPIVFTFFFLWFPSGLVLYWVVNNVLSIAQQYVITKRVEAGTDKASKSKA